MRRDGVSDADVGRFLTAYKTPTPAPVATAAASKAETVEDIAQEASLKKYVRIVKFTRQPPESKTCVDPVFKSVLLGIEQSEWRRQE